MPATNRDLVVIGASAGGIEDLKTLLARLAPDLPAALLVVQHLAAESPGFLAEVLDRAGPLPVRFGRPGEEIRPGRVYLAAPDQHLLVEDSTLRLTRGPRENRARPAIDPLFRSAAVAYGSRVIGVILSGYLNDGTAGLLAVKRSGGLAVVLDPEDTLYPDMPRHALAQVAVDHTLPRAALAGVLAQLVAEPPGPRMEIPADLRLENQAGIKGMSETGLNQQLGHQVPLSCPECGGPFWRLEQDGMQRYRCHTGHAFSAENLLAAQEDSLEQALWAALRSLEERYSLLTSMLEQAREKGRKFSQGELSRRAEETTAHINSLRTFLLANETGRGTGNGERSEKEEQLIPG